eukprot:m.1638988 g.1638988  ORF g.1638988 m.1638988 type:complete len:301 (-) comp32292_c0_seq1:150-1052(-)
MEKDSNASTPCAAAADNMTATTLPRNFTIAVEGNIASGKSTLLQYFQSRGAQVIMEPVDKWQNLTSESSGNILMRMYEDPARWAYLFQSYVLLTMMEAHDEPQTQPLRVMERSVYSARWCFIENLRKSTPPLLDDMESAVYIRTYDWLMQQKKPHVDLIVYLRTSPEVCMHRLKKRARHEESSVPIEYLQSLHARYEEWLMEDSERHGVDVPVLILDGDVDNIESADCLESNYQRVLQRIQTQDESDVPFPSKTAGKHEPLHCASPSESRRSVATPSVTPSVAGTPFDLSTTERVRKLVL